MSTKFTFDGTLSESAPNNVGTGSTLTPSSNTPITFVPVVSTSFPLDSDLTSYDPYIHGSEQLVTQHLVEITVYLDGAETTLYYSTHGCVVGSHYYEPRIINAGSIESNLFADGTTMGRSTMNFGEVTLVNTDGELDNLLNAGFSGRPIVIKELIGSTVTTIVEFVMEQPTFNNDTLSIRIKDTQYLVDISVQPRKYGGSNLLPDGVDGTIDIKGKPKPILYGSCKNITPVCVNTSRLIYQLHYDALESITDVYDKGVALTFGVDRTSDNDLLLNMPAAGTYDTCLVRGLFRLGSSPFGTVTADAIEGTQNSAARIAGRMYSGTTAMGCNEASISALETLNPATVGIYITEERKLPEVMDEVLQSVGGWWRLDTSKTLYMGRFDGPITTPVLSLSQTEILSLDRLATQDEGRGVPTWKVTMNYDKNNTVQDAASLAGRLSFDGYWKQATIPAGSWNFAVHGNGLVVSVKWNTGVIAYSSNGLTWTEVTISGATDLSYATYGDGMFMVFHDGTNRKYYTSTDAITWTERLFPIVPFAITSVNYGGGIFVVSVMLPTTFSYTLYTSTNGVDWVNRTIPDTVKGFSNLAYCNDKWVCVVYQTLSSYTSPDCITWTAGTSLSISGQWGKPIYANGIYAVCAYDKSYILTSPNAITWTQRTTPSSGWTKIAYTDGWFMLMASSGSTFLTSQDAITWTQHSLPSSISYGGVATAFGKFIVLATTESTIYLFEIAPDAIHCAYVRDQYRSVVYPDSDIKITHLNASEITINSLIVDFTEAEIEAARQLYLRAYRRDYIQVKIKKSAISTIPLDGEVVNITYPRYEYNGGKNFTQIGHQLLLESNEVILKLWG